MTLLHKVFVELGEDETAAPTARIEQLTQWLDGARLQIEHDPNVPRTVDAAVLDYVVLQLVADRARNPSRDATLEVAVDDARVVRKLAQAGIMYDLTPWYPMLGAAGVTDSAFSTSPDFEPGRGSAPLNAFELNLGTSLAGYSVDTSGYLGVGGLPAPDGDGYISLP